MANQLRGEIEIDFDGKKIVLRPTFEGLLQMEDKGALPISTILQRFIKSEWSIRMVSAVIYGGLYHYVDPKTGDQTYPFEKVGRVLVKSGMGAFLIPALHLVSNSINPVKEDGEESPGKKESAPANESPTSLSAGGNS